MCFLCLHESLSFCLLFKAAVDNTENIEGDQADSDKEDNIMFINDDPDKDVKLRYTLGQLRVSWLYLPHYGFYLNIVAEDYIKFAEQFQYGSRWS